MKWMVLEHSYQVCGHDFHYGSSSACSSFCLSICLPRRWPALYLCPTIYFMPVHVSVCHYVWVSFCLSVTLPLFACMSFMSVCYMCKSLFLPVCHYLCLSFYLRPHVSFSLYMFSILFLSVSLHASLSFCVCLSVILYMSCHFMSCLSVFHECSSVPVNLSLTLNALTRCIRVPSRARVIALAWRDLIKWNCLGSAPERACLHWPAEACRGLVARRLEELVRGFSGSMSIVGAQLRVTCGHC